jgi:hypothetical protein
MLISNRMADWLRAGNNGAELVASCKARSVYLLPAFETHGASIPESADLADKFVGYDKPQLVRSWLGANARVHGH